jgi:hypothetical protein
VDDVIIFCNGQRGDAKTLSNILGIFSKASGMQINDRKSTLLVKKMEYEVIIFYQSLFPFELKDIDSGLKDLGFQLNPKSYLKSDWTWVIAKLGK